MPGAAADPPGTRRKSPEPVGNPSAGGGVERATGGEGADVELVEDPADRTRPAPGTGPTDVAPGVGRRVEGAARPVGKGAPPSTRNA